MEQYTIEQRAQIVEIYFSNQRSIVLTQRAYRRQFNVRVAPSQSTINRLVANFREQGAVRKLPGPGRHRTVHTADNIQVVQESIREDPETSSRRRSSQLGLSRTSLQRILHTIGVSTGKASKNKHPEILATGKGRGRPKKIQKMDNKEEIANGDDDEDVVGTVGDTGKKSKTSKKSNAKGRGRPKRVKNSDDESSDDKMDDAEERRPVGRPATGAVRLNIVATGRGQGRPKQKNKVAAGNEKQRGRPSTGKTAKSAYVPTGKPRGRPRPKKMEEVEDDEVNDEENKSDKEDEHNGEDDQVEEVTDSEDDL